MVNDPVFDAFYTQAMAATSVDEVKQVVSRCERVRCATAFRNISASTDDFQPRSAVAQGLQRSKRCALWELWPELPVLLSGAILDRPEHEEDHGTLEIWPKSMILEIMYVG